MIKLINEWISPCMIVSAGKPTSAAVWVSFRNQHCTDDVTSPHYNNS